MVKNIEKENEERRKRAMMTMITQVQKNNGQCIRPQYAPNYGTIRSRQ